MQYDWINFYTEFATKLLPFKTNRKALIKKIYAVYNTAKIKVPKLESDYEIIDIDPFTIFGTFNKGITDTNKIAILNGIASEFNISATVPNNFDGIPGLNNLKATFYAFKEEKQMILIICGTYLRRPFCLLTMIQKLAVRSFQQLMIKYMTSLAFVGILLWAFIGFVLTHLST